MAAVTWLVQALVCFSSTYATPPSQAPAATNRCQQTGTCESGKENSATNYGGDKSHLRTQALRASDKEVGRRPEQRRPQTH